MNETWDAYTIETYCPRQYLPDVSTWVEDGHTRNNIIKTIEEYIDGRWVYRLDLREEKLPLPHGEIWEAKLSREDLKKVWELSVKRQQCLEAESESIEENIKEYHKKEAKYLKKRIAEIIKGE